MAPTFTPASTAFGAEVSDVDLRDLSDTDIATIDQAWATHGVLFFRDQQLTPEDHIALAQRFAEIDVNRFFAKVDGHPQIAQVLKEADQVQNIGGGWHTDHSYDAAPARGSILLAREVPPVGGDTLFASSAAAYNLLSDGMKEMLGTLSAKHSNEHIFGASAQHQREMGDRLQNPEGVGSSVHPVIVAHPATGQPVIYVNPAFTIGIQGWSEEESTMLLTHLYGLIGKTENTVRFRWEVGSVAMWDNRSTWHWALNDYPGQRRHMHRITVAGETLSGLA